MSSHFEFEGETHLIESSDAEITLGCKFVFNGKEESTHFIEGSDGDIIELDNDGLKRLHEILCEHFKKNKEEKRFGDFAFGDQGSRIEFEPDGVRFVFDCDKNLCVFDEEEIRGLYRVLHERFGD